MGGYGGEYQDFAVDQAWCVIMIGFLDFMTGGICNGKITNGRRTNSDISRQGSKTGR